MNLQKVVPVVLGALVILGGAYFIWRHFFQERIHLPTGDTILLNMNTPADNEGPIYETDGVKHSVPLDQILSGGPPQDGIPPIDDPKFNSLDEAEAFLTDDDPGIGVTIDNDARFYPYQILVWHEIVNDTFNGRRVLVTYCPLCVTGIVFDPLVDGEHVEFGTSGKLWNANLVMYDRKTESLWSQVLGEAIVGPKTGERLEVLESDVTTWGRWKAANPEGRVLSRDTGAQRFYGVDPYGDYYTTPGVRFPLTNRDDRLDEKAFVLGVILNGASKAYPSTAIQDAGEIRDTVGGVEIVMRWNEELDYARIYKVTDQGEMRINPIPGFWFSWASAHPDTELYQP